MKAFDLERAKAGEPVCLRNGQAARIICFDRKHPDWKIVALVHIYGSEEESVEVFRINGSWRPDNITDPLDLIMA